jgi:hypothetical protein
MSMSAISSAPVTALSVLTAPGAPLSASLAPTPNAILKSANPTDLSSLSTEAVALSEANGLFATTAPDLFQATGLFQSTDVSITDAAFGLTPTSFTAPLSLDPLLASYGAVTKNTGTLINTIG